MKRAILISLGASLLVATFVLIRLVTGSSQPGRVDAERLVAAIEAYKLDLKSQGHAVPPAVTLEKLISRGFLRHEEVSGFDGMEVVVSLDADETQPQKAILRARLKDGHELILLADGSVQSKAP